MRQAQGFSESISRERACAWRRGRWRHIFAISLCLLFPATGSFAVSVESAVRLAASRPLLIFALSQPGLPQEVRAVADVISARTGYEGTGIGTVTERNFRVFPSLRYDGNINGGFENSRFDVGGLTFSVDPSSQSISGMLVGANIQTGLHASLLEGLALEARAEGSFEVSPEHHLTKSFLYTDLCLRYRASLSMYFHTCVDRMYRRFELGKSTQTGIRVGATRLLAFGGGFHELSTELRFDEHLREDISYTQAVASIGILSALRGPIALFAKADFGTDEPGIMTMQRQLRVGATRIVLGQPTSVSIAWQERSGGIFFGSPRVDHTVSGQIRRKISDGLSVSVTALKTESTVEFFERNSVGAQLSLRF